MKKIGMIGGFGPESTLDYYRRIQARYRKLAKDDSYPEIIINSMDMTAMLRLVAEKKWEELVAFLVGGIESLRKAGADFAFVSANTPHIVFEQVKQQSPIELISIVEATRQYADQLGLRNVGLLGTSFTMNSNYYQTEFNKSTIRMIVPKVEEKQFIQEKLMSEIEQGIFLDSTRQDLLCIVKRMMDTDKIEGVVLGCTELPLILTKNEFGIPFLNTTEIHVESIVQKCMQE